MNEYIKAYNQFNDQLSEGLVLEGHSGSINKVFINDAKGFYEHDEIMAEESFSNFLDSENLDQLVSLENCFDNYIGDILEVQILESFINGNFSQAKNQLENLYQTSDFFDFIEDNDQELKILRKLVRDIY